MLNTRGVRRGMLALLLVSGVACKQSSSVQAPAQTVPTDTPEIAALRVTANAGDADAQQNLGFAYANGEPQAMGHSQLEGVLNCTLDFPALTGLAQADLIAREVYERGNDRIVRINIRDKGRTAVVSTPLATTSRSYDILFIANRGVFNLFIEKAEYSSSVFALSRGVPGIPGELVYMSAGGGGISRHHECSWVALETRGGK